MKAAADKRRAIREEKLAEKARLKAEKAAQKAAEKEKGKGKAREVAPSPPVDMQIHPQAFNTYMVPSGSMYGQQPGSNFMPSQPAPYPPYGVAGRNPSGRPSAIIDTRNFAQVYAASQAGGSSAGGSRAHFSPQ